MVGGPVRINHHGTTGCVHATSTSPCAYGFGCGFDDVTFART
jgi:hypothetical protein